MGYAMLKQESTVTTLDFMGHCRGALQVYWFVWCPSIQNSGEGNYVQGQSHRSRQTFVDFCQVSDVSTFWWDATFCVTYVYYSIKELLYQSFPELMFVFNSWW